MAKARNPVLAFLVWLPERALIGLARILPYRARLAFGSAFLRAAVALVPDLRRRVERNLRLIYPDMPAPERARIRSAMADSFGRTFIEVMAARQFHARADWNEPSGPGWEALLEARAAGKGVLLVSGHFGQWEAVRGALKARGMEAGALYRPVNNPWLERTYRESMSFSGEPLLPRDRQGMRELVRHLKKGGIFAILLDQYVQNGDPVDFLGHPAPTGTAIAALALRFGAPMIPAYGTRQPDGVSVAIEFEPPIAIGTPESMTQAAADSLSARVRARPEQYYWLHRRWVKRFPTD